MKPLLKIAGGKGRFKHRIEDIYDKACEVHGRELDWVDPFCGGLSIPLYLRPEKEVLLNDANPYLINFYEYVQQFSTYTMEMKNEEDYYYEKRGEFNRLINAINGSWRNNYELKYKLAELYYYLNRTGFNGLMRFNRKGEFNTPFGRYKYTKYADNFIEHTELFQYWKFFNLDWKEFLKRSTNSNSYIFADPPYFDTWGDYLSEKFTWENQVELAETLAKHPGAVLATNSAHPKIIDLYSSLGFEIDYVNRVERIGGKTEKIGKIAKEMYATRNIAGI